MSLLTTSKASKNIFSSINNARAVALFCLSLLPQVMFGASPAGTVVNAIGTVLAKGKVIRAGDKVYSEDSIVTQAKSSVKLLMIDQTVLDLGELTTFVVEHYDVPSIPNRDVSLKVEQGVVRTSVNRKAEGVKGKFFIRTRSSVMAVRGTEVVVSSLGAKKEMKDEFTVVTGVAEVSSTGSGTAQRIEAGKQLVVAGLYDAGRFQPTNTPTVRELNAPQLTALVKTARMEDRTFGDAIRIGGGDVATATGGRETLAMLSGGLGDKTVGIPRVSDIETAGRGRGEPDPGAQNRRQVIPVNVTVLFTP